MTGQTVTAVWDPNPTADQVVNYEVCISTTALSCNVQRVTVPATQTTYVFAPTPGVLNRVAVRAISASGAGSFSGEVPVSIPSITPIANKTSTVNTAITPFTVAVADPDGSSLTFSHTGLPFGLTLNQTSGVISGTPTSTGSYNVTIMVSDGLVTTSFAFVWTIQSGSSDATAPAVSITSHTSGQTVTTATITLSGTASDAGTGDNGISSVRVNGVVASGGTSSGTGTATWSRAVSLVNGANTLTVIATDGAGNARTTQITINLAVPDTSVPSLSITSHTQGQTVTASSITLGGTATDSGTGGSGIARVTINGTQATGGAAFGSNTTVWSGSVALVPGTNTITVVATDGAGNSRQLQITINYNAPAVVSVVSSSPNTGAGATQTFALQYSDNRGANDLSKVWVWFNATFGTTSANSCMAYYDLASSKLFMLNDSSTWLSGALGVATVLQNSQCAINLAGSSVAMSGATLTLNLATTFKSGYAGAKNIYMYGQNGTTNSGWQARGTWTVPGAGGTVVTADSAHPANGSGATQTFSLKYSDTLGAADLSQVWVWFSGTFASTSANSCMLYYDLLSGRLQMLNDGSAWMPGTLGTSTTLQNNQCAVDLAGSSVAMNGNTVTVNLAMTFKSGWAGPKNIFMFGRNGTTNSGWQTRGAWTVPGVGGPLITADSATPSSGSGATQTFSLKYSDTLGATDFSHVWVWFNATFASTSTNSCLLYYDRPSGKLLLLSDSWSWMAGTPGNAVTLQNSQCAVDLAGSSVTLSGNTLTLNLAMTFKPEYAGAKNIYLYGANVANVTSGWQLRGTWTVP